MTTPPDYLAVTNYYAESDPMRLLTLRETDASARIRGSLLAAAARIGLASERCIELDEQITQTQQQLRNAPSWLGTGELMSLEQRVLSLQAELATERRELWKDLQPLAEAARDAGVERQRRGFLREMIRGLEEVTDEP
ncbi:hypothetical protein [Mucisphaera calidilacus]|uniref:Uncharacterized protein n=1 Tax=Mucisphaera calidilacus TaxID=2527982 RepID=A0A518BU02_9BACT|nr:hypothetical protein [Mucisphaera calidilacus]QDU70450.1 hypothetical protein Pan265_02780 [Mucisphaera calidilacus]